MPSQPPAISGLLPLAALLRERRISIVQLSQKTGISERLISKYKSGVVVPRDYFGDPTPNGLKVAEAVGEPFDSLFPVVVDDEAAA